MAHFHLQNRPLFRISIVAEQDFIEFLGRQTQCLEDITVSAIGGLQLCEGVSFSVTFSF